MTQQSTDISLRLRRPLTIAALIGALVLATAFSAGTEPREFADGFASTTLALNPILRPVAQTVEWTVTATELIKSRLQRIEGDE